MSGNFALPIRIYYEDTDFSGNVYHGSYVRFFERARTELLRNLGIHHHELAAQGFAFVVSKMEIDFISPAQIDDLLLVGAKIISLSGARIIIEQEIRREKTLLAKANIIAALIDKRGRPARIPKEWQRILLSSKLTNKAN